MSLLSYQLQIKRYQKELGLSDRDFNKLNAKYSGVNLIKQLQILNQRPKAPSATGWYGTLEIISGTIKGGATVENGVAKISVENEPLFVLTKVNEITKEPIQGVKFAIYEIDENRIEIPK